MITGVLQRQLGVGSTCGCVSVPASSSDGCGVLETGSIVLCLLVTYSQRSCMNQKAHHQLKNCDHIHLLRQLCSLCPVCCIHSSSSIGSTLDAISTGRISLRFVTLLGNQLAENCCVVEQ